MGGHDRLFKELLQEFFVDFIHLMLPGWVDRLRPEEAVFLRDETFLDLPRGNRRQMDLLVRVPTLQGPPEMILVHVEIEGRGSRRVGRRMWRYSLAIRQRHDRPLVPLVLQLTGGPPGLRQHYHRETLFGEEMVRFVYWRLALEQCRPEDYLRRPEPLAWALSSLMRGGDLQPVRHKLGILERLANAPVDDVRRHLLAFCTETYLQLDRNDQEELRTMILESEDDNLLSLWQSCGHWADRLWEDARREGRSAGMVNILLRQLDRRFGPLPEGLEARVRAEPRQRLEELAERLLEADSLEELDLR